MFPNITYTSKYNQAPHPPQVCQNSRHQYPKIQITKHRTQISSHHKQNKSSPKHQASKSNDKSVKSTRKRKKYNHNRNSSNYGEKGGKVRHVSSIIKNQEEEPKLLLIKKISTPFKPPHRYKTRISCVKDSLIVYGGLGCQKNLSWGKLNLYGDEWHFPSEERNSFKQQYYGKYHPPCPVYGHSMVSYKDRVIIFGGMCADQVNETTILNIKNMEFSQAIRCPFRRRDHASCVIGKYMVVQGGIEARQIQSQILLYDIENDRWGVPDCKALPFLSHHSITNPHQKKVRKSRMPSDISTESGYIFGGLSKSGVQTNTLYRIKILNESEVICESIPTFHTPPPRYSCCFQTLNSKMILLYGGKTTLEGDGENRRNGVYSDIHLLMVDQRKWVIPRIFGDVGLGCRFGMGSCTGRNKIYIFGGSLEKTYADADIYTIMVQKESRHEHSEICTQGTLHTFKHL